MKFPRPVLLLVFSAVLGVLSSSSPSLLRGQSAQPNVSPPSSTPDWQIAAGGSATFDVASIRNNKLGLGPPDNVPSSNFPLDDGPSYSSNGGLFSAKNFALDDFIAFAFKMTRYQHRDLLRQLPKWNTTIRFDIQARAQGNPSKDQMRLMMQALLADRFKLSGHYEIRDLPAFTMVLAKRGKMGLQLQLHPNDQVCSANSASTEALGYASAPEIVRGGYPAICGIVLGLPSSVGGRARMGASNVSMQFLANTLTGAGQIDRPVIDRTGFQGNVDFIIEWTPEIGPLPPGSPFHPDPTGPTFVQAVQEELGLKLEPEMAPVKIFVIDHVEEPSPN